MKSTLIVIERLFARWLSMISRSDNPCVGLRRLAAEWSSLVTADLRFVIALRSHDFCGQIEGIIQSISRFIDSDGLAFFTFAKRSESQWLQLNFISRTKRPAKVRVEASKEMEIMLFKYLYASFLKAFYEFTHDRVVYTSELECLWVPEKFHYFFFGELLCRHLFVTVSPGKFTLSDMSRACKWLNSSSQHCSWHKRNLSISQFSGELCFGSTLITLLLAAFLHCFASHGRCRQSGKQQMKSKSWSNASIFYIIFISTRTRSKRLWHERSDPATNYGDERFKRPAWCLEPRE